jgi:uncharacterized protein YceH (UPF0502 family)
VSVSFVRLPQRVHPQRGRLEAVVGVRLVAARGRLARPLDLLVGDRGEDARVERAGCSSATLEFAAVELSRPEIRVLGCLIEKQRTTPEAYPLTLNSLRLACNQSTNRDPVVEYDETTVREAAERLARRRLTRFTTGHGSRAPKYRQLVDEALGLSPDETALLGVLMLRGPQTPGELKTRSERLQPFEGLHAVQETLEQLAGRELVARLERRPGQKEDRYAQLLGGEAEEAAAEPPVALGEAREAVEERVARLEAEVRDLRGTLEELRRDLGA